MYTGDLPDKQEIADSLQEFEDDLEDMSERFGLHDPVKRDTQYWVVSYDEMDELSAYGGFPERFPHWRWAIKYLQMTNSPGHIFEMVLNEDPAETYLQESNSVADQKAVMAHVEAHADFFANNEAFRIDSSLNAVQMMERHREKIKEMDRDPDIDRFAREYLTDTMLALEYNIDPARTLKKVAEESEELEWEAEIDDALENMGISDAVLGEYEDELKGILESQREESVEQRQKRQRIERDLMKVLKDHGQVYDDEEDGAVDMEDWHRELIDIHRREAYYFKPQALTKTMNEGWAAYWESMMMGNEGYATVEEMWNYSKHQAMVLNSPGYNPYKVGKDLWEYVENDANRTEVVEKLLQTEFEDRDGNTVRITPENFHDVVNPREVLTALTPDDFVDSVTSYTVDELQNIESEKLDKETLSDIDDETLQEKPWKALTYDGLADRHFSLLRRQNQDFLFNISDEDLNKIETYLPETPAYSSVEDAMDDVEKTTGWDTMSEIRETHNDVTFIHKFVTDEWAKRNEYSATETLEGIEEDWIGPIDVVTSHDVEDIKKNLLVMFNNFGKPIVEAYDTNYDNKGELLLVNDYNGYEMDREQAKALNEMVFDHYGKPVNLVTVEKVRDEEYQEQLQMAKMEVLWGQFYDDYDPEMEGIWPVPEERAVRMRYDGEGHEEELVTRGEMRQEGWEPALTSSHPYETVPEEWLEDGYEDKYL